MSSVVSFSGELLTCPSLELAKHHRRSALANLLLILDHRRRVNRGDILDMFANVSWVPSKLSYPQS